MNNILFLCTGNYYRSRFSEEYLSHFLKLQNKVYEVDSMGIQRSFVGNGNVGAMSSHTLEKLAELSIVPQGARRMPKRVETEDFTNFDRVIAVSKDEHKPMLEALWPENIIKDVEYFDVEDLHIEGSNTALPRLIKHLDALLLEL